jgi:hypothetical protein
MRAHQKISLILLFTAAAFALGLLGVLTAHAAGFSNTWGTSPQSKNPKLLSATFSGTGPHLVRSDAGNVIFGDPLSVDSIRDLGSNMTLTLGPTTTLNSDAGNVITRPSGNHPLTIRGAASSIAGILFQNSTPTTVGQVGYAGGAGQGVTGSVTGDVILTTDQAFLLGVQASGNEITKISAGERREKFHAAFATSEHYWDTVAVQTTNATVTTIYSLTLADNTVYSFRAECVARGTAGVERAIYGKDALIYRQAAGAATLQGAVGTLHADVETTAGIDTTWAVNTNDARLNVTGLAATTINWVCSVEYQAVSGNS